MKVYVTKYALAQGIIVYENAEITGDGTAIAYPTKSIIQYFYKEGCDWHRTKESAVARCEEIRIKKLKSLEKQMMKISKIVFDN